jgi:hypothetical protein
MFAAADSVDKLPAGCHPQAFKKINSTFKIHDPNNNTIVIKAVYRASASGISRKIRIDPQKYPIVQ